jgi:serine phosphatase RsbU (regulator of sigma subunit)
MKCNNSRAAAQILLFILFSYIPFFASAQKINEADSLQKALPKLDGNEKLTALNRIAWIHIHTDNNWKKIDSIAQITLPLARQFGDKKAEADALLNQSFPVFNLQKDIKKSSELLEKALLIYTDLSDTLGMAWTNQQLGYNCFFLGKLAEMKNYYIAAHRFFYAKEKFGRLKWLESSTNTYFEGYTKLEGLVAFYQEIIDYYQKIGHKKAVSYFTAKLIIANAGYEQFEAAKILIQKSEQSAEVLPPCFEKVYYFLQKGTYYRYIQQNDSVMLMAQKAQKIADKINNLYAAAPAYYTQAVIYITWEKYELADSLINIIIKKLDSIDDVSYANVLSAQAGMYFFNANQYAYALKYYYSHLKKMQEFGLSDEISVAYSYISGIYRVLNEYDKALENAQLALKTLPYHAENYKEGGLLNNLGYIYYLKADYPAALANLQKAETISTENNLQIFLVPNYFWQSLTYFKLLNYEKAGEYFEKTILSKNKIGIKVQYGNFTIDVYSYMAEMQIQLKNYDKALHFIQKSEEEFKADVTQNNSVLMKIYDIFYQIHKNKGNSALALEYLEKHLMLKTKVENEENSRKITQLEIMSATEKKESENELLRKDNLLKEIEAKEQTFNRNILLAGLSFMALLLIIVFLNYRQKRKAAHILKMQKDEISIQAQNLEKANTEITIQKNEIEKSHKHITASITYAQRIQHAVLPSQARISELLGEHLLLYMPRDIVSGDFYFFKPYKNYVFLAAADCTGHGVPGAFMSMLGVALLNEIVEKSDIQDAASALDELRKQVKNALQQTGNRGEQQDGMDIVFCALNLDNQHLSFACANNPLLIFRQGELIEYKADKMPVGIYKNEKPFTNQETFLQKNDVLYLFSDGYFSQFKHLTKEPMKSRRFKDFLTEIQDLTFKAQEQKLRDFLAEWKGTEPQIDDILVMGFRM